MPAPPAATGAIVVVGASTRPLAASAASAGWQVHAADLFADLDLRESAASAVRVRPYPEGLPAAVTAFPAGPWFYTGAMENHPEIINAISQTRPLAGSDIDAKQRPCQQLLVVSEHLPRELSAYLCTALAALRT